MCRQIARWVADNRSELEHHEPEVPDWMFNRQADNWRPLLAIADIVSDGWPERARAVAATVCGNAGEETSVKVLLLTDIGKLFERYGVEQLESATIAQDLAEMDDRPWPEWGRAAKPITKAQIARQLKSFGISSGTIRDGHSTAKGYKLADLKDPLCRYGGLQSVTPSQVNVRASYSSSQNVTEDTSVTAKNPENPRVSAGCDGVTFRTGESGPAGVFVGENPDPDDVAERAAIMEYDGELSRDEAEHLAQQG